MSKHGDAIGHLRAELEAARQQVVTLTESMAQARRDIDSLQHLYESASATESVIFGWKDRPVGSSAEAARTLIRRYEEAQHELTRRTDELRSVLVGKVELREQIDALNAKCDGLVAELEIARGLKGRRA